MISFIFSTKDVFLIYSLLLSTQLINAGGSPITISFLLARVTAVYNSFLYNILLYDEHIGSITNSNSLPCDLWILIIYACLNLLKSVCVNVTSLSS